MVVVPYDNPQLVIYCVVNQPNAADQAHSYYAQNIVREILEEVLPYMNIYPDEELTGRNADLDITGNNPPDHSYTNGVVEQTPADDTIEEIAPGDAAQDTTSQDSTTAQDTTTQDTTSQDTASQDSATAQD